MAVHTRHPIAAPPSAPIREKTGHLLLRGWCIAVIAAALAGSSWTELFGQTGVSILVCASAVVSGALWAMLRPEVQWRRLPWLALLYVAWAVVSLIWTAYPEATATTLVLLIATTGQAMFVGAVLTWRELVRAIASALKWILSLSLIFEGWVALVWRGPILPGFGRPDDAASEIAVWSHGNLFGGGRIQGLFGSGNALAFVALLGMIVFAVRWWSRAPRRPGLVAWFALAAFAFVRAGSATGWLAAAAVIVVLATVLLMRRTSRPGERTGYYIGFAAVGAGGLGVLWAWRDGVFAALGRSADLTGREGIWASVWDAAAQRPGLGWGFATPWPRTQPPFLQWTTAHGHAITNAHSMWLDAMFQLGAIGAVLLVLVMLAFVWRSWFFAVDRPRWDLVADRPYSPFTLIPTLVAAILLVQGLAESDPLLGWGWAFIVLFAFKIKQAPLIGRGPSERRLTGEQGEATG